MSNLEQEYSTSTELESLENNSSWQVIYLDTFTLMLIFFILLASIAYSDEGILGDVTDTFRDQVLGIPVRETPIDEVYQALLYHLEDKREQGVLQVEKEYDEIRLHFLGSSFYRSAEADLLPEGMAIVEQIMQVLLALEHYAFHIDVEGHADSMPIQTERFPSNWDLSASRASNVVRYFLQQGMPAERLKASGYADTFPVAPDFDERGMPITENLDRNRRIVMRVHYGLGY